MALTKKSVPINFGHICSHVGVSGNAAVATVAVAVVGAGMQSPTGLVRGWGVSRAGDALCMSAASEIFELQSGQSSGDRWWGLQAMWVD